MFRLETFRTQLDIWIVSFGPHSVPVIHALSVAHSFVLNTTISAPHEAQITDMCFCQAADSQTTMLVSTSKDGRFKCWQLAPPAHAEGKPSSPQPC